MQQQQQQQQQSENVQLLEATLQMQKGNIPVTGMNSFGKMASAQMSASQGLSQSSTAQCQVVLPSLISQQQQRTQQQLMQLQFHQQQQQLLLQQQMLQYQSLNSTEGESCSGPGKVSLNNSSLTQKQDQAGSGSMSPLSTAGLPTRQQQLPDSMLKKIAESLISNVCDSRMQSWSGSSSNDENLDEKGPKDMPMIDGTPVANAPTDFRSSSMDDTDPQLAAALDLFEQGIASLYQSSMIRAGYTLDQVLETSPEYRHFVIHAWSRESQKIQRGTHSTRPPEARAADGNSDIRAMASLTRNSTASGNGVTGASSSQDGSQKRSPRS